MLPGAAHQPTDVATFKDLAANATKIMICLMYGSGGRSIAGRFSILDGMRIRCTIG